MTLPLLYEENENLSPDARCLLWRWGCQVRLTNAWTSPLRSLYDTLHVSPRQGASAMANLQAEGMIEAIPKPANGRGRPGYIYQIAPTIQQALARRSKPSPVLLANIQRLLEVSPHAAAFGTSASDNDESAGYLEQAHARKYRLTMANRWVLAVLLAHADNHGAVTSISQAQLQRLTGLSQSRLHSQRSKLMALGVIVRYISGSASKRQGTRLTSVYLLNLRHQDIVVSEGSDVLMTLPPIREGRPYDTSLCHYQVRALFELTHAITKTRLRRKRRFFDHYQAALGVLPNDDYAAPRWDVIRKLPQDTNLMAWLRVWVHRAAMTYFNAKAASLIQRRTVSSAPIKTILRDRTALADLVEMSQHRALTKALSRLAVYLANELLEWMMQKIQTMDMTIPRTYRLIPVSVAPQEASGSSKRVPCWQLLGTPSEPERCRDVLAGNVKIHRAALIR